MTVAVEHVKHPCPYPEQVLEHFQHWIGQHRLDIRRPPAVLDPMAGEGRIHRLEHCNVWSIELEPEFAVHERTIVGDARDIVQHFAGYPFDIIAVSPAYANRMADQYLPPESDTSRRYTYATALGRRCSEGSGAALQWGDDYRELHRSVWEAVAAHHRLGGLWLLNVKNHYRGGEEQPVTEWHIDTLRHLGYAVVEDVELGTDGIKHSPHRDRFPERVVVLRRQQPSLFDKEQAA